MQHCFPVCVNVLWLREGFSSQPAGDGHCRGSRCLRYEWQVVIYADLCSRREPLDRFIISHYSAEESKRKTG